MLNQLKSLSINVDGRYATDEELKFLIGYAQSYKVRRSAYEKLHDAESAIVDRMQTQLQAKHAELLPDADLKRKWREDTIRVLRHTALAVLLDDPNGHKERFLYWFQTLMQAFGVEKACNATYTIAQETVANILPRAESNLVTPILMLNRDLLGTVAPKT